MANDPNEEVTKPVRRRRTRTSSEAPQEVGPEQAGVAEPPTAPRRRGRPPKTAAASMEAESGVPDAGEAEAAKPRRRRAKKTEPEAQVPQLTPEVMPDAAGSEASRLPTSDGVPEAALPAVSEVPQTPPAGSPSAEPEVLGPSAPEVAPLPSALNGRPRVPQPAVRPVPPMGPRSQRGRNDRYRDLRDPREARAPREVRDMPEVRDREPQLSITQLEQMSLLDLYKMAKALDIADYRSLSKSDLMWEIMRARTHRDGLIFAQGLLDVVGDFGFLRPADFARSREDVYVSGSQIRRFDLRPGDLVSGQARPPK